MANCSLAQYTYIHTKGSKQKSTSNPGPPHKQKYDQGGSPQAELRPGRLGECLGNCSGRLGRLGPIHARPLWGSLGGLGRLGECLGILWGGLGGVGEGLGNAWGVLRGGLGRLGEAWEGLGKASGLLGRLGEACSIDARPLWGSLGGLGELGECLGPQNHHQNEDHPMSQLHLCPSLLQMREHSCKSE